MSLNIAEILESLQTLLRGPAAGISTPGRHRKIVQFRKGQTIFRDGEECPGAYVVGRGMVRVYKTGPGGKEHVLHIVAPGGTFAEAAAIGGFEVPATRRGDRRDDLALLPQKAFHNFLAEDHELCLGMMRGLTLWVRHLVGLMEDVVLRDAAGRVARYLLQTPRDAAGRIELPGLKRHVASHLNLTSETFSRTFRRLLDGGMIAECGGNRLQLLDCAGLQNVAEGRFPRLLKGPRRERVSGAEADEIPNIQISKPDRKFRYFPFPEGEGVFHLVVNLRPASPADCCFHVTRFQRSPRSPPARPAAGRRRQSRCGRRRRPPARKHWRTTRCNR